MSDEPTRCRKCGGFYNLRDGEDPTLYCDWCAHKVVDELTAKLERDCESDSIVASCNCLTKTNEIQHHKPGCKYRLIVERDDARAKLADAERMIESAKRTFLLSESGKACLELADERDAAIARAEAAEKSDRNQTELIESYENALREICLLFNVDPSEGEGTSGQEVFELVKRNVEAEKKTQQEADELLEGAINKGRKLEAERDELRREVAAMEHRNGEFAKALEDYEAQVLSLEADKARLDWLGETKCHVVWSDRACGFYIQRNGQVCGNISGAHREVREAIDAARKESK